MTIRDEDHPQKMALRINQQHALQKSTQKLALLQKFY